MRRVEFDIWFPDPDMADEDGIVAVGGSLTPQRLVAAYRNGVFPWPMLGDRMPIPWCSPDPRAIIEFDDLHVSRRLRRTIKANKFALTCNRAFFDVIHGCAAPRANESGTWITGEMLRAYCRLHDLGFAHSVEVWQHDALVGGIYGVALGGVFSGESMFHRVDDASKVALVCLTRHLQRRGYQLFDIQQWTPHTGSLGATEVPRHEFLERLRAARDLDVTFGPFLEETDL